MGSIPKDAASRESAVRRVVIPALLLMVGFQIWLIADSQLTRPMWKVAVLLGGLVLLAVPSARRFVAIVDEKLRNPSARTRRVIAVVIGAVSAGHLYFTAVQQDRVFMPVYTDESSYLIQARMLSEFSLWQDRHELADFFDSFYVITEPVYASQYFPGTAMWVAPFLKLGLPYWIAMLAATSIAVATMYLLSCEIFDGTIGILAAAMMLALPSVRMVSIMMLSQPVALMLVAVAMYCFVRALRTASWGSIIGLAISGSWLAITRPADAVALLTPLWVVLLWSLPSHRRRVTVLVVAAAASLPMLALQIRANRGVTGDFFTTPFSYYAMRDNPRTSIGFRGVDDAVQIVSDIPQKRQFYDQSIRPLIREHTPTNALRKWALDRPRQIARETLPDLLLLILLPLGIFQSWNRARVAVASGLVAFCAVYFLYVFFLVHYFVVLLPCIWMLVFGGVERLGKARIFGLVGVAMATLLALPQFNRHAMDMFFTPTLEPGVREKLATLPHQPAVVLFKYSPTQSLEEEAVYNVEHARIDAHRVIRAHDLGVRNAELFRYYASKGDNRAIYRFDRADNSVEFLGFAQDLAK